MKFSPFTLLALTLGTALAQTPSATVTVPPSTETSTSTVTVPATGCAAAAFSAIPTCAQQCISNGAVSLGCASGTDFACQCRQQVALFAAAQGCINSSCQQGDLQAVIGGADSGSSFLFSPLSL